MIGGCSRVRCGGDGFKLCPFMNYFPFSLPLPLPLRPSPPPPLPSLAPFLGMRSFVSQYRFTHCRIPWQDTRRRGKGQGKLLPFPLPVNLDPSMAQRISPSCLPVSSRSSERGKGWRARVGSEGTEGKSRYRSNAKVQFPLTCGAEREREREKRCAHSRSPRCTQDETVSREGRVRGEEGKREIQCRGYSPTAISRVSQRCVDSSTLRRGLGRQDRGFKGEEGEASKGVVVVAVSHLNLLPLPVRDDMCVCVCGRRIVWLGKDFHCFLSLSV